MGCRRRSDDQASACNSDDNTLADNISEAGDEGEQHALEEQVAYETPSGDIEMEEREQPEVERQEGEQRESANDDRTVTDPEEDIGSPSYYYSPSCPSTMQSPMMTPITSTMG